MSDVYVKEHPEHTAQQQRYGNYYQPAKPLRASWWLQFKREWRCWRSGGHYWHPEGMIDWFCCQCGAETDGMPKDGARR